jgi:predicted XRE-type DNA-binding protein
MDTNAEIIVYEPDEMTRMNVYVKGDTVCLTQAQIAQLFGVGQPAISKHLKNIFASGELNMQSVHSILEYTASDGKSYMTGFYNLDAILSVGYRVNSRNATVFRQWANRILREYLLKGYSFNARLLQLSSDIDQRLEKQSRTLEEHSLIIDEHSKKIDFFIKTSLPPIEGIFYDGQIFDSYKFVCDLVKTARYRVVLLDNYIDESVFTLLDKRAEGVTAVVYTAKVTPQLQLDIQKHNSQYPPIIVRFFNKAHDRFLIIDDIVYHIGASIKDLGRKWFAFTLMRDLTAEDVLSRLCDYPL